MGYASGASGRSDSDRAFQLGELLEGRAAVFDAGLASVRIERPITCGRRTVHSETDDCNDDGGSTGIMPLLAADDEPSKRLNDAAVVFSEVMATPDKGMRNEHVSGLDVRHALGSRSVISVSDAGALLQVASLSAPRSFLANDSAAG